MENKRILTNLEFFARRLGEDFIIKYFGKLTEVEYYWIVDDPMGVLCVSDYFFDLNDIVDFSRYKYSKKKMFQYYDYALNERMKNKYPVNIKNYLKTK